MRLKGHCMLSEDEILEYNREAHRVARAKGYSAADIDDAIQETWLYILDNAKSVTRSLFIEMVLRCISRLRKQWRGVIG